MGPMSENRHSGVKWLKQFRNNFQPARIGLEIILKHLACIHINQFGISVKGVIDIYRYNLFELCLSGTVIN